MIVGQRKEAMPRGMFPSKPLDIGYSPVSLSCFQVYCLSISTLTWVPSQTSDHALRPPEWYPPWASLPPISPCCSIAVPAAPPARSTLGQPSLEKLIWHPSDLSIKPIVANRRIERLPEPKWDPVTLSFRALVRVLDL